ncbi:MAG: class I SAM-dependent methyltransferase [Candidatus Dormibacteria bacterium]
MVDLGVSPLSNALVSPADVGSKETFYPLQIFVCARCFLVQSPTQQTPEQLFPPDYAYFSSYSTTWLAHAKQFVESIISRLALRPTDLVVELASNDGYLLQYFAANSIAVLGIEPAANVAAAAEARGIRTQQSFFNSSVATEVRRTQGPAKLVVANNVLAHVPDLNDFVSGIATLLDSTGTATIEFPHVLNLINDVQFDTIYHEHFSYFSLYAASSVFERHRLTVVDVEELPTHGGSLRLYVCPAGRPAAPHVAALIEREKSAGLNRLETFCGFSGRVDAVKHKLLRFLIESRESGKRVVGYGAAAKASTLLNYCGIRTDLIDFIADLSTRKQGSFIPGVRVPIVDPGRIEAERPEYVLILPWNLRNEIAEQLHVVRSWHGQFVVALPSLEVF